MQHLKKYIKFCSLKSAKAKSIATGHNKYAKLLLEIFIFLKIKNTPPAEMFDRISSRTQESCPSFRQQQDAGEVNLIRIF